MSSGRSEKKQLLLEVERDRKAFLANVKKIAETSGSLAISQNVEVRLTVEVPEGFCWLVLPVGEPKQAASISTTGNLNAGEPLPQSVTFSQTQPLKVNRASAVFTSEGIELALESRPADGVYQRVLLEDTDELQDYAVVAVSDTELK